ncbi:hypothetical protein [Streptomyces sp. NBC_00582]|uniref:hypothetical protein n=1 Tax=Streptomyces sp. NBC_00582 TaxID=2975783 RepID=UPI002E814CCC|nr:hypothetical protein [Streptomyces sp. NBC_00582]WUB68534.1 hypothetical protein OG852_50445 [Streptomyces sp. NBC_00582]
MSPQSSGPVAEWFPSSVTYNELGPYDAEVLGHRRDGMVLPRFTAQVMRQIADEARTVTPDTPRIRLADGIAEILDRGRPPGVVERCTPDAAGRFALGHGTLPWHEYTSVDTAAFTHALDDAQAAGYPPAALDTWTIAFVDHGHRMALLAVYRSPDENAAAYDALYNALYAGGLSSYETTQARADAAELAARRHFSRERAHVTPGTVVWPTVAPATRITAGPC